MGTRAVIGRARRWARYEIEDRAITGGRRRYEPRPLPAERWEAWFSDPEHFRAARAADHRERLKFALLVDYLRSVTSEQASILDVGCGAGVMRDFADGLPFAHWRGVDPTAAAIAVAAERHSDERTTFMVADPLDLPAAPRWDVIVCAEVLYQVPRPFDLVDRMVELLVPGGRLLTSIWCHPGDGVLWDALGARMEQERLAHVVAPGDDVAPRGWKVGMHRAP